MGVEITYEPIDFEKEVANCNIEPYSDGNTNRLIVAEYKAVTAGGLHLPDTSKQGPMAEMQTNFGIVIRTGEGVTFCQPGETVYYGKYSGTWITWKGSRYRLMNEEDILGRVEV